MVSFVSSALLAGKRALRRQQAEDSPRRAPARREAAAAAASDLVLREQSCGPMALTLLQRGRRKGSQRNARAVVKKGPAKGDVVLHVAARLDATDATLDPWEVSEGSVTAVNVNPLDNHVYYSVHLGKDDREVVTGGVAIVPQESKDAQVILAAKAYVAEVAQGLRDVAPLRRAGRQGTPPQRDIAAALSSLGALADGVPALAPRVSLGEAARKVHSVLADRAREQLASAEAELLLMRARGSLRAGAHAEALRDADAAIERTPERRGPHLVRAESLRGLGRAREAGVSEKFADQLGPEQQQEEEGLEPVRPGMIRASSKGPICSEAVQSARSTLLSEGSSSWASGNNALDEDGLRENAVSYDEDEDEDAEGCGEEEGGRGDDKTAALSAEESRSGMSGCKLVNPFDDVEASEPVARFGGLEPVPFVPIERAFSPSARAELEDLGISIAQEIDDFLQSADVAVC